MKNNVVGWFEVPVLDLDRAVEFYETVFDLKLQRQQAGPLAMALFPALEEGAGSPGSLVCFEQFYQPRDNGPLLYFTAHSGDLANELSRVAAAGGTVLMEKKLIAEDVGYMGLFLDTEGNRIAMHSRA